MIALSIAGAFSVMGIAFFLLGIYDLKEKRPVDAAVDVIVSGACILMAAIFYFGYVAIQ